LRDNDEDDTEDLPIEITDKPDILLLKPFPCKVSKSTKTYQHWLQQLKDRIRFSQIKAALKVNAELLGLYWHLGTEILDKERSAPWGTSFLPRLSKDLQNEFPELKGFSLTNLKYIRIWVAFYQPIIGQQVVDQLEVSFEPQKPGKSSAEARKQVVKKFGQQPVDQIPAFLTIIPWGHHLQIITKCKKIEEALFYISETSKNNWSRAVLVHQMESCLYKRKGKSLSNFEYTLPAPQSDLAKELLKNPYNLGFLSLSDKASEKDLEDALINHLIKFLLELGSGFAFIGRQYLIKVEDKEFYIDLLFYHTRLHCYMVVELKIDEFKPEYTGKLNFYLSVIDEQLKTKNDQPSIGLLLCKKAGKLIVEYSLRNVNKPIGVSEYKLVTESVPIYLKGKLPTIEEIEAELKNITESS
jgi:predicted nuclease of restriction endonuclease-like (RecB) superfamily